MLEHPGPHAAGTCGARGPSVRVQRQSKHRPSLLVPAQIAGRPLRANTPVLELELCTGRPHGALNRPQPAGHPCQSGLRMADSLLAAVRHCQSAEVLLSLLESAHVRQELNK